MRRHKIDIRRRSILGILPNSVLEELAPDIRHRPRKEIENHILDHWDEYSLTVGMHARGVIHVHCGDLLTPTKMITHGVVTGRFTSRPLQP